MGKAVGYLVVYLLVWALWFWQFQGDGDVPWWQRVPWWQWVLAGLSLVAVLSYVVTYLAKRTKR